MKLMQTNDNDDDDDCYVRAGKDKASDGQGASYLSLQSPVFCAGGALLVHKAVGGTHPASSSLGITQWFVLAVPQRLRGSASQDKSNARF